MDLGSDPLEECVRGRRMQKRPPTKVGSLYAILSIRIRYKLRLSRKRLRYLIMVLSIC